MRNAEIIRKTAETDIVLSLNLDGNGVADIDTGCGFLNHMLTLLAAHSNIDLKIRCVGDTDVDYHHSAEDIGICLGQAFSKAIGNAKGIRRYGNMMLPMDETLILSAVDLSGRSHLAFDLPMRAKKIGTFDVELVEEFFLAFVRNCPMSLHIRSLAGKNAHHIVEGAFKSVARSLRAAVSVDPNFADVIPSTKGVL